MFGKIARNLKSQKAGANTVDKVSYTAALVCPEVLQKVDKQAGASLSEQHTLATQLLAVFLLDYVIENVVKVEVASIYHETNENDLHQFLYGVERQMKHNSLLADSGMVHAMSLRRWIQDQTRLRGSPCDQQAYDRIIGQWFAEQLGVPGKDSLFYHRVGSVLRAEAFGLYVGSQAAKQPE